jgi:excisionase family DNA binding protein
MFMYKDEITFDKLPQAITYLTEQVAELKQLVSVLQPPPSEKHVLVGIDDACRIIQKAKPTIYTLVRKGLLPAYKKGKKLYFYEDELLGWIENGRRNTSEQNYDRMLADMQKGVRHKPKSGLNL